MILNKQNQPFKIFLNQPSYPSLGSAWDIYIYDDDGLDKG